MKMSEKTKRRKCAAFIAVILFVVGVFPALTSGASEYEVLTNPGFEDGMEPWNAYVHATMDLMEDDPAQGVHYVFVSNKYNAVDGPRQFITEPLRHYGMGKYRLSAWVKMKGDITGPVSALIVVQTQSSDKTFGSEQFPGQMWFTTEEFPVNDQTWTKIEGEVELQWSQTLEMAEFYFLLKGDASLDNYFVDGCSMTVLEFTGEPFSNPDVSENGDDSEGQGSSSDETGDEESSGDESTPVSTDIPGAQPIVLIGAGAAVIILVIIGAFLVLKPKEKKEKEKDKDKDSSSDEPV